MFAKKDGTRYFRKVEKVYKEAKKRIVNLSKNSF